MEGERDAKDGDDGPTFGACRVRRACALAAFAVVVASAAPSRAQTHAADSPVDAPAPADLEPERAEPVAAGDGPTRRLEWRYPRFRWWQVAASAATSGINLCMQYCTGGEFPDHRVDGGFLFDAPLRRALLVPDGSDRETLRKISDITWPATQYFPIFDSILTPLVSDRFNYDTAIQLTLINWQTMSLAFFFTRATHITAGRARPSRTPGPSFLSGHASMAAAGAALTCAHHQALPLYGAAWADTGICVLTSTSALVTGVLRIMVDRHWTTDVLAGFGIGAAVGLGIPYLLHYQFGQPAAADAERGHAGVHWMIAPTWHDGPGLSLRGINW